MQIRGPRDAAPIALHKGLDHGPRLGQPGQQRLILGGAEHGHAILLEVDSIHVRADRHAAGGAALHDAASAFCEESRIASAVRARPLTGWWMPVRGQFLPCAGIQRPGHASGRIIPGVRHQGRQRLHRHQCIGRAVVFGEGPLLGGVVEDAFEPAEGIFLQPRVVQGLARNKRDIGAQNRDVGVARPHIALLYGPGGMENGSVDLRLQVGWNSLAVVQDHLQQFPPAEVRPVPVRWGHLLQRFLQKPAPYAIGSARRILVLQTDHTFDDVP